MLDSLAAAEAVPRGKQKQVISIPLLTTICFIFLSRRREEEPGTAANESCVHALSATNG